MRLRHGHVSVPAEDAREGLMTLVRVRLMVATLALPVGVLFRPDAGEMPWPTLGWAMIAVGVLSALFWLAARLGKGLAAQGFVQLACDLMLVTALAAMTGGRESQFVLFYALVAITGGLMAGLTGGALAAAGACVAYAWLPRLQGAWGQPASSGATWLQPGLLAAFLGVTGVLAGVLGRRVRQARAELARTARELDRVRVDNDVILRHLATGVLTVDAWGSIAYLNPAAESVLGVRALEIRGRPIAQALPERLAPLTALVSDTLERHSSRTRAEIDVRNGRGATLPLGLSTNLLTHERSVTGVVAVFQDLTEVREMERRARRQKSLAELGALAAGIAHELRNGLTPISGSAEYLQRELKLEGESAVLVGLIATECARLNRFVTDLLGYARERDPVLAPIDLGAQLTAFVQSLAHDPRVTGQRLQVRLQKPELPVTVRADAEQLRQVWLNLSGNAFEAMSPGGTLTVRLVADGTRARVEFSDEGSGIAPEHLARLGEPFFTTKEGGTGLGLAIAHRIAERHGGSLLIEGAPGIGATVRVSLPLVADPALVHAA